MPAHRLLSILVVAVGLMTACTNSSPYVVKIGLVAPFEGRYREIGYDVIPAARLAVREFSAQHPDAPFVVELVAYDDLADAERAVTQAERLVADAAVEAVIGHWLLEPTMAAVPVYAEHAVPLYTTFPKEQLQESNEQISIAPDSFALGIAIDRSFQPDADLLSTPDPDVIGGAVWGLSQFWLLHTTEVQFASAYYMPEDAPESTRIAQNSAQFNADFRQGSGGQPPGLYSSIAYELTWLALNDLARQHGLPAAADLASDLDCCIYMYRWHNGTRRLVSVYP